MKKFGFKINKFKRIIAMTVCLIMLLGLVFQVNLLSAPEGEQPQPEEAVTRVADESTMNGWREFFTKEADTSNVGKIWTDKTVVDGDVNLTSLNDESAVVRRKNENNFLVGLSALSSSKTLTLEAAIPVDVMFVLDVSGSMKGTNAHPKIGKLIEAVNNSIQELLDINEKNRIGVVLYSGAPLPEYEGSKANSAYCVLPLDHYTADGGKYFQVEEELSIQIEKSVRNSKGESMYEEGKWYLVEGSTYIQNGLQQAFEKMLPMQDETFGQRIPIITLMSDGAPTAVSEKYTERGDATIDTISNTDLRMSFLTQLTAAWVKEKLQNSYQVKPLFYTVGLISELAEVDNKCARAVLNPKGSENIPKMNEWWESFWNASVGEKITLQEEAGKKITVQKEDDLLTKEKASRYYVDEFYNANSAGELIDVFKKLVEKIKIASAELPTEEEENPNYSGYLVFEDDLGKYMDVKHVSGVTYAGNLHTGSGFAEKMQENGTAEESEKAAFIDSLVTRLEISPENAAELLENAQTTGQISYKGTGEDASNYIAWYADQDGKYVAPFINGKDIPKDAKIVNRSYFYYGNSKGTISGEKMMYLGVRVAENLETKEQKVYFFLPASLLPLVTYNVFRNALDQTKSHIEKTMAYPVRLFYEVGLKSGISEYNLENIQEEDLKYLNSSKKGRMGTFYQSFWTENAENKEAGTFVDFAPSDENEYYYYTEDTLIYTKDENGKFYLYEGNRPSEQDGKEYYSRKFVDKLAGNGEYVMLPISSALFGKVEERQSRQWSIPKGTFREEVLGEQKKNTEKYDTDTASYVQKTILKPNTDQNDIRVFLGNNGKSVLRQGKLEVTKTVKDEQYFEGDGPNTEFSFRMGLGTVKNVTICSTKGAYPVENGNVDFTLKHNEKVEFWLPAGTKLSMEEVGDDKNHYGTTMTVTQNEETDSPQKTEKVEDVFIFTQSMSKVEISNESNGTIAVYDFFMRDEDMKPLGGAVFNLYKLDCDNPEHVEIHNGQLIDAVYNAQTLNEKNVSECWSLISTAKSKASTGQIKFLDEKNENMVLKVGTYRLVELKAPDGYEKPIGQWNITILPGSDKNIEILGISGERGEKPPAISEAENRIFIFNYKPINPPITGGRGIDRFLILGAAVTVGGLMLTVHLILQRRRGKI